MNHKKQRFRDYYSKDKLKKNTLVVTAIGVFIGLLSPFGMDSIPLLTSVIYWVICCLVGYAIYAPTIALSDIHLQPFISRKWQRIALGCVPSTLIMCLAAAVITRAFFDVPIMFAIQFSENLARTSLIGGVITVIAFFRDEFDSKRQQLNETQHALNEVQEQHKESLDQNYLEFMTNIPVEKRGELLCLEMADHYLTVHTDKGHHMMLMRLKDAVALLNNYPGMQTHRSWWVAHAAISKVVKDGRKLHLKLKNDIEVPVSRSFADKVKAAGFAE